MDINLLTIDATRIAIQQRQTTATAIAEAFYKKIEAEDGEINAYLTLSRDRALEQARKIDTLADKGEDLPPLGGVPVAIKDVISTKGVRTTAGSKILENFIAPYDRT